MAETILMHNHSGDPIGSFTFDESPVHLHAMRTANGFKLQLPFKLSLAPVVKGALAPMVSDFRGVIMASTPDGRVEIGHLYSESSCSYTAGYRDRDASVKGHENIGQMIWLGSLADLTYYNKLREGGPAQFIIRLEWRLCHVFPMADSGHMACTLPEWRRPNLGDIPVRYSRDLWVGMLRSLRVAENVLVEIPLPGTPPPGWDGVWEGLCNAKIAFEQGGSTGWKGCVMGVRLALENWQNIEHEDLSQSDKTKRTKKQRLDHLRWSLLQIGHFFAHNPAEECSRDDALLLLSTLSALLAERKP
jgi:hypothetical protein